MPDSVDRALENIKDNLVSDLAIISSVSIFKTFIRVREGWVVPHVVGCAARQCDTAVVQFLPFHVSLPPPRPPSPPPSLQVCGGGPRAGIFHLKSLALTTVLPPTSPTIHVTKFTRHAEGGDRGGIVVAGGLTECVWTKIC